MTFRVLILVLLVAGASLAPPFAAAEGPTEEPEGPDDGVCTRTNTNGPPEVRLCQNPSPP